MPTRLKLVSSIAFLLVSVASLCAQDRDLSRYTKCELGNDFEIVQVDGPVTDFAWQAPMKSGDTSINVETGYRVLIAYQKTELFGNLKAERLPAPSYESEKAKLLSSLDSLATDTGMEPRLAKALLNGFNLYGVNRTKLEGGVLSVYNLFSDADHVTVTMYLLNDEPETRKFHTMEQYAKVRDAFLQSYTACVKKNGTAVRAK